MKRAVLVLTFVVAFANSLNIQDASVFSGNGDVEENPAAEGDAVTLRCSLSLDNNKDWVTCSWKHLLTDQFTNDNEQLQVVCTTADKQGTGDACNNQGGSTYLQNYASRLSMDVGSNYCGLRISEAHPYDTGEWTCHVNDDPQGSSQFGTVDLFVSNHSQIYISDPPNEDMDLNNREPITYDANDRGEIEAECTSIGGRPEPTFHWYVNDDRNEIDESALSISDSRTEWWGVPVIKQTIRWEPTIDELCDDYDLDEEACESNEGSKDRRRAKFTFALICKVEQDNLYQQENENQEATVMVDFNGSRGLYSSVPMLVLSVAAAAAFSML